MKNIFKKIFNNKSKDKEKKYTNFVLPKIQNYSNIIASKDVISFLHYGHLGDIVDSLPVIQEISKNKICDLYIQSEKKIPAHDQSKDHPFGNVYLTENLFKRFTTFKGTKFLRKVEFYKEQKIDIDLNFFRALR